MCGHQAAAGAWALAKWQTGAALTRQFAFLSLIVIELITAALAPVIAYSLRKDLLEREWRITADFVHTEALYHLDPTEPPTPRSPPGPTGSSSWPAPPIIANPYRPRAPGNRRGQMPVTGKSPR